MSHQCRFVMEGPKVKEGPGRGKSWWRRQCKRMVTDDNDLCWQHRPLTDPPPPTSKGKR